MVHCGYYDLNILDGVYEHHVNLFQVAESFDDARAKVKLQPEYISKKLHVDGLVEIEAVNGFRIQPTADETLNGGDLLKSSRHRDLAPKAAT